MLRIDGSLAQNIDFEIANLEVSKKTRRKTSILRLQSVKIGGSLTRNARFGSHLSRLAPLILWWLRRVYRGSCKIYPFGMFQSVKIGEVSHEMLVGAPTCLVSSLYFAVSMGVAAKPLLVEGFQAGCHVVLRGRRGTL